MKSSDQLAHTNECKCLSWKPVVAGALVAVGLSFLLNLFSVAIGLTAYTTNSEGVENLAFGGLIGTAIGVIASMFAAGWLSGYLSQRHCSKRHLGALYGFLTWCVALIVAFFITADAQQYVAYYGHFLAGVNNAAASNAAAAAATQSTNSLVLSTYIVFCLFFLSAFASSLGGHCGMRHVCKNPGSC
ncbi:MAG: hypothetical protein V4501_06900 [Pseudomonadota bacterium]